MKIIKNEYFEFPGNIYVQLINKSKKSRISKVFGNYYSNFRASDPYELNENQKIKIIVRKQLSPPTSAKNLGLDIAYYNGKGFIKKYNCWIESDLKNIEVDCSFPPNRLIVFFEALLRKKYIESGLTFLHGSGFIYNGYPLLFVAWRHTGKTSILLKFLNHPKIEGYIADDRFIIDEKGSIYMYPIPINFFGYNKTKELKNRMNFFSWLSFNFRDKSHRCIGRLIQKKGSRVFLVLRKLNNSLVQPNRRISIRELNPDLLAPKKIENPPFLFLLQKDKYAGTNAGIFRIVNLIKTISWAEWNDNIQELLYPHIFFSDNEIDLLELYKKEKEIIEKFVKKANMFIVNVSEIDGSLIDRLLNSTLKEVPILT